MDSKPPLIIPVENQVREFDAKLLLALIAAKRGFPAVLGSRLEIDFRIGSFPRGIYLSKSMTARSLKMFRIMRLLGHQIAAWDEEALVHMQPETYFTRRLSKEAIQYVSHLFAWGQENAELWRQYPHLPENTPIHIVGNPRGDLLRPELHAYYEQEVQKLTDRYGDFILINTNFSNVNAFVPSLNLFMPVENPGETTRFGRGAVGMDRKFAEGLRDFKQAVFEDIKNVIPALENAFPDFSIIVRPHPTENPQIYRDIANTCQHVEVTNEGNVVPWIMAAKALVHNSCTTGIEACIMGVPAVSYMATRDEYYDLGYYKLPNRMSHQCFSFTELQETLGKIFAGELGPAKSEEQKRLLEYYLTAQNGRMACERIVDVLEEIVGDRAELPATPLQEQLVGRYRALRRRFIKWRKSFQSGSKYQPEFQRHRYPGLTMDQLHERLARFQHVLGDKTEMKTEQLSDYIFRISTCP